MDLGNCASHRNAARVWGRRLTSAWASGLKSYIRLISESQRFLSINIQGKHLREVIGFFFIDGVQHAILHPNFQGFAQILSVFHRWSLMSFRNSDTKVSSSHCEGYLICLKDLCAWFTCGTSANRCGDRPRKSLCKSSIPGSEYMHTCVSAINFNRSSLGNR